MSPCDILNSNTCNQLSHSDIGKLIIDNQPTTIGFVNLRLHNKISGAVTMVLAPAEHRLSGVSYQNDVTQMIAVRVTTQIPAILS